ncbi:MAG: hypothetical protein LBR79_04475 [Oscillospiraceae bacterium]|nr:hypothetical protein [Oscillospiraceae bacterium]
MWPKLADNISSLRLRREKNCNNTTFLILFLIKKSGRAIKQLKFLLSPRPRRGERYYQLIWPTTKIRCVFDSLPPQVGGKRTIIIPRF